MRGMRWRTDLRAGHVPGQPATPLTDARRIPHIRLRQHTCGWCGGKVADSTRKVNRARVLCHQCMRSEFGSAEAYDQFIRTERARTREREKKQQRLTQVK
jgi:hypothetical protein